MTSFWEKELGLGGETLNDWNYGNPSFKWKAYMEITVEELAELVGAPLVEDEKNVEAVGEYIRRCMDEYEYYVWEHMNSGGMIFNYRQFLLDCWSDFEEYNEIRFVGINYDE